MAGRGHLLSSLNSMNPSYCDLQKTYPLFWMKTDGKSLLTNSIGKRLSELQSDLKVFGIITVDLVREPTKISISAAQSFVENLKAEPGVTECMIAPGNHDVKRILGNIWRPDECSQAFGLKGAVWHKIFQPAGLVLFKNVRLSAC